MYAMLYFLNHRWRAGMNDKPFTTSILFLSRKYLLQIACFQLKRLKVFAFQEPQWISIFFYHLTPFSFLTLLLKIDSKGVNMQTPKSRQHRAAGSDTDSSTNSARSSPKIPERRSPRSPSTEKRPGRINVLESKLTQLEKELKRSKDQLNSSDSCKTRAQKEADEAKQQLEVMALKLEDSQHQLLELSAAEEARLLELRKISQERDKAWESELEALQKQHAVDSSALASAMNEIKWLKLQLERATESESALFKQAEKAYNELQSSRKDMIETLMLVENLKFQLQECTESESQSKAILYETSLKFESAKSTIATLQSDGNKATELLGSVTCKLDEYRAEVCSLEETVGKLQNDVVDVASRTCSDSEDCNILPQPNGESGQLNLDISSLQMEAEQLRFALEAAEKRCQEQQAQSSIQIQSAYELVECTKNESILREAELESKVEKTSAEIEELKANLMDKETELQSICSENEGLSLELSRHQLSLAEQPGLELELAKARELIFDLKANLMDKETELQSICEENELLKAELEKGQPERGEGNAEVGAAEVAEQLEAAQAANLEMEAELKRLRVQTDQWRKAAEAAAAMISTGGKNGKLLDRSGSLDSDHHIGSKILSSPYSEDADYDESLKKKNNMIKKIGVLWKKGQK